MNDTTIDNVLTGVTLVPTPPTPGTTLPILLQNLQYTTDPHLQQFAWSPDGRNLAYAGNLIYRLGPNVLLGLEASQARTNYFLRPNRLNNHYDLALGYLF